LSERDFGNNRDGSAEPCSTSVARDKHRRIGVTQSIAPGSCGIRLWLGILSEGLEVNRQDAFRYECFRKAAGKELVHAYL
jgi:hypothetical protein